MKAPKCPQCGKTHYSTQRCGAGHRLDRPPETTPPTPLSLAVHGGDEAPQGGYDKAWDAVKPRGEEKARIEKSATEFVDAVIKEALTPAEKQKAYRERLKDDPEAYEEYLEANKLRMRNKRDGN